MVGCALCAFGGLNCEFWLLTFVLWVGMVFVSGCACVDLDCWGLLIRAYSGGLAGRVLRVILVSVWVGIVVWVARVLCLGFGVSVTLGLVYGFDLVWIWCWVFLYLNVYFLCRFVWLGA